MNSRMILLPLVCLASAPVFAADTPAPQQQGISPELIANATAARMTIKLVKGQGEVDQAAWEKTCAMVQDLDTLIKKACPGYLQKVSQTCDEMVKNLPKGVYGSVFPELLEQTRAIELANNEVAFGYSLSKSVVNPEVWAQVTDIIKTLRSKETADYRDVKIALLTIVQYGQGDGGAPTASATAPEASTPAPVAEATKSECQK